ncbi:MAG: winged helix-turn-helix domain-containing protein, partial [Chloroflexi bacterium]|nr:winged helix-turn-helix domain-containing protein [Chloroflexota bacterium]
KSGQALDLTLTEFRLLHYLMANPDVVLPTDGLLRQVWGYDDASAHNVVRTAVHRLRQKIEDDPAQPRYLRTVAGVGFILQAA